MNGLRLFDSVGQGVWIEDWIRIVPHVRQRCEIAHGMVHARHVHGFRCLFMADTENVEIDFMREIHIFEIGVPPIRERLEEGVGVDVANRKLEFTDVVTMVEFPLEFVNHDGTKGEIDGGVFDSFAAEQPVQIFS